MTIRPIFAIYSPTALATLGQWLPEQYDRLNEAYQPTGVRFATDSPVVDLTGAFGGQPLDLANGPAIEAALRAAIAAQSPALAAAIEADPAYVPVYIADYVPYTHPDGNRADVHGYADYWNPTQPYAGIFLNHDRVPGNTVLHTETGQQVQTNGNTLVHEFAHWFADEKHQFTPNQSCITNPALRGKINYMDYDADICRGTWTPEQIEAIARLTGQRLAAGRGPQALAAYRADASAAPSEVVKGMIRADRIATAAAAFGLFVVGYSLFDYLFSTPRNN